VNEPQFDVMEVLCCVCHGTGKVPRLWLFKRDCNVCDGKGERPILVNRSLTPTDRESVIQSAILGFLPYQHKPTW
jgi:RecJ-like exonuclease